MHVHAYVVCQVSITVGVAGGIAAAVLLLVGALYCIKARSTKFLRPKYPDR